MNLPNHNIAYVPKQKLKDYLLSETHAVGKAKARFFRTIGYSEDNADQLIDALLMIAKNETVINRVATPYGIKYIIDGEIVGPAGSNAHIRTVWVVERYDNRPRFVTAYPI